MQPYELNIMPQMWPSVLPLTMTLTLNFQGQIFSLPYLRKNIGYHLSNIVVILIMSQQIHHCNGWSSLLSKNAVLGNVIGCLGMGSASERWHYNVTAHLIGWAHTRNDPCAHKMSLWSRSFSVSCQDYIWTPGFPGRNLRWNLISYWHLCVSIGGAREGVRTLLTGLILGLHPANETPRCKVMPSLIGWAQTYNQPWLMMEYYCDHNNHGIINLWQLKCLFNSLSRLI